MPKSNKKTIKYHLLWPGGNTTALVEQKFDRKNYAVIANKIMAENSKIEQVGFLESKKNKHSNLHLQMMGGEFCGNATRAAAFFWGIKNKREAVKITASGSDKTHHVKITKNTSHINFDGDFFIDIEPHKKGYIVDLKGIRHIIIFDKPNHRESRELIKKHKKDFAAVGVIYSKLKGKVIEITPLIWVRDTNSFIPETGCASGSIAAAIAAKFHGNKIDKFSIIQPSKKKYAVKLTQEKTHSVKKLALQKISLNGYIKHLKAGKIEINSDELK